MNVSTPQAAAPDKTPGDAATQIVSLYQAQQKIYPRAVSGWFAGLGLVAAGVGAVGPG